MTDRKDELRAIMAAGYEARDELQEIEAAELNATNAVLIGTCQKFRNSYGGDDKVWWLYRRILSVHGEWCTCFTFQHCSDGRIEVRLEKYGSLVDSAYTPINEEEFEAAYREILAAIDKAHAHRGAVSANE